MSAHPSVFTDADRAEMQRLLDGIADAERARRIASARATEAQEEADAAAHEVGRWEKAYADQVAKLRQEAGRV